MFQRPFLLDTSALINIERRNSLQRLDRLVNMTVAQWTPGIAAEVRRREDRLRQWLDQRPGETELSPEESLLFRELILLYGQPFQYQGRTRKPISSEDAEALAVATKRGWTLVTDDGSMAIVSNMFAGTSVGTDAFLNQLGQLDL